jgi:hypothetical protein
MAGKCGINKGGATISDSSGVTNANYVTRLNAVRAKAEAARDAFLKTKCPVTCLRKNHTESTLEDIVKFRQGTIHGITVITVYEVGCKWTASFECQDIVIPINLAKFKGLIPRQ